MLKVIIICVTYKHYENFAKKGTLNVRKSRKYKNLEQIQQI